MYGHLNIKNTIIKVWINVVYNGICYLKALFRRKMVARVMKASFNSACKSCIRVVEQCKDVLDGPAECQQDHKDAETGAYCSPVTRIAILHVEVDSLSETVELDNALRL